MWVYPYNFVQYGEDVNRSEPPSWERLEGLSGRLECTLRNLTPLFIPDPSEICQADTNRKIEHKFAHFFNVGDTLAIPPTSLRGMIRAVAEAATNSCLSTFRIPSEEEKSRDRFLWRRDQGFMGGRDAFRRKDGKLSFSKGVWQFRPYNAAKIPIYIVDRLVKSGSLPAYPNQLNPTSIKITKCLELHSRTQVIVEGSINGKSFSLDKKVIPNGKVLLRGRRSYIEWNDAGNSKEAKCPINGFNITAGSDVTEVVIYKTFEGEDNGRVASLKLNGTLHSANSGPCKADGIIVPPPDYHARGGMAADPFKNLKFHRVLYGNLGMAVNLNARLLEELEWIIRDRYDKALGNKSELHFDCVDDWNDKPVTCQFTNDRAGEPVALGPVSMLLEYYRNHPADLLPEALHPCKKINRLCPACRLFGMVGTGSGEALAGRISFGPGYSNVAPGPMNMTAVELRILGSPKPAYFPFYLTDDGGTPINYSGERVTSFRDNGKWRHGYEHGTKPELRGRKFYWHHSPQQPDRYRIEIKDKFDKEPENYPWTSQNMTGQILTALDQEFRFSITFENLSSGELGLLLWSLELEEELAHKLGHGRPIGLGSVRITIDKLFFFDKGFIDLDNPGEEDKTAEKQAFIDEFKKAEGTAPNTSHYNWRPKSHLQTPFDNLPFINDLKKMLSWNKRPDCQSHYVAYVTKDYKVDELPDLLRKRKLGEPDRSRTRWSQVLEALNEVVK